MRKKYYLVSACLGGIKCRYNGSGVVSPKLLTFLKDKSVLLVCPEKMGGLSTPRNPAQIVIPSYTQGRNKRNKINPGNEVWNNRAWVIDSQGKNCTTSFKKGALFILNLIRPFKKILTAYLKSKSPSCGCGEVYIRENKNSIRLVKGDGVFTALLKKHHIKTISWSN